eukprot:380401_1
MQRKLLLHGMMMFGPVGIVGFGLGTATGLIFKNRRGGISGHIEAQLNGAWMVSVGLIIPHLNLSKAWLKGMYRLLLIGTWSHLVAYGFLAFTGGKYDILSSASENQSFIA